MTQFIDTLVGIFQSSGIDGTDDEAQAVVVTPGRELALQSANVLKNMVSLS